jgi:uncharacterized protein YtpQ (UPF0354 family)
MRIGRRELMAMGLFGAIGAWLVVTKIYGRANGDVGEFRETVMAAVRARPGVDSVTPDPRDRAKFKMVRGGQPSTADVTNLFGYISAYSEENADELIARFVKSLTEDMGLPIKDSAIVPVIRGRDYIEDIARRGLEVLHEPAGADLMVVYMADRPDSMSPINAHDVPDKTLADVRELALDNLRSWLPKVVADPSLGEGVLYLVEGNPMLSTGLVILDEFWKSVAARFPGDVLIALPRRDQLFIFNDDGSARTKALARQLIKATLEDNFNLLSPLLYARRKGKILVVTD